MIKYTVVFTKDAISQQQEMLHTYAASRRAAVEWADGWARRRGWLVLSVTPTHNHQPLSNSNSAPESRPGA